MKKSIKRRYRIKKKTIKNRTRKNRRNKSSRARGSMEECCMCGSKFVKKTALVPQECLMKYGKNRAHKVCPQCWWGEFAKEGASHKCPGCVKGLPVAKDVNAGKVIDLTEDVDDIIESLEDGVEEEI
jgi:hypothetical protein